MMINTIISMARAGVFRQGRLNKLTSRISHHSKISLRFAATCPYQHQETQQRHQPHYHQERQQKQQVLDQQQAHQTHEILSPSTAQTEINSSHRARRQQHQQQQPKQIAQPTTQSTSATTEKQAQPFDSIPGPSPSFPYIGTNWAYMPLIGPFAGLDINESNQLKYRKYGPIVKEELSPGYPVLTIFDPTDIKQVFKSEATCPARPKLEYIVKHRQSDPERYPNVGIVNMMGSEWREWRSKLAPLMLSKGLKDRFIESQNQISGKLVDFVRYKSSVTSKCKQNNSNYDGEMESDFDSIENSKKINSKQNFNIDNRNGNANNATTSYVIDNVQDIFSRYAMESIMNLCISHEITCMGDSKATMAAEDGEKLLNAAMLFFEAQHKLYYGNKILNYYKSHSQYEQLCSSHNEIHDIASKYIDRVLDKLQDDNISEHERETILDTLYKSKAFDNTLEIKASIVDFIIGGIYPLANALTMTLYLLATNPSAQERVYNEIRNINLANNDDNINDDRHKSGASQNQQHTKQQLDDVEFDSPQSISDMNDINLDIEKIQHLKYLKQCLKEAHRMMPTIPGIARIIQRDLTLSNYHVPKNTLVFCNSMTTCRMAKYFERPDEFVPERWDRNSPLRDASKNPDLNFAMLQFGYGARKCIGHTFADLQMNITLAKLIFSYRIEPVDPSSDSSNLEREFQFIVVPKNPVKLKFIPRKH